MPPNALKLVRTETKPSNGARTRRLSMLRSATCTASCALLRFSRNPAVDASTGVAVRLHVGVELRRAAARASSSSSTFCCALMRARPARWPAHRARRGARRTARAAARLRRRPACTAASASAFTISCSASGDRSGPARGRTPAPRRSNSTTTSPAFTAVARVGELHDLQLSAHRRHGQLRRARRPQLAVREHVDVDAPALHARRRDRSRRRRRHAPPDRPGREPQWPRRRRRAPAS